MKIGLCLPTETENMGGDTPSGAQVLHMARRAEEVGFDSVWLVDHFCYSAAAELEALGATPPAQLVGKTYGAWECLITTAALARDTSRVELGTLVVNTGYRNPALLARMETIRLSPDHPEPRAEPSFILRNLPRLYLAFERRS